MNKHAKGITKSELRAKIKPNRMIAQAEKVGADAVINLRYTTTSIIGSAAELLAYGTAVKLS